VEREKRGELLERIRSQPYRFVGVDRESDDADPAIAPWLGHVHVLVHRDAPERFWEDPRLRLGVCSYFPDEDETEHDESQCPYKLASILAAPTVALLYSGALLAMRRDYPELSRRAIVQDLRRRFKPVRVELSLVRVAVVLDDPALVGGEPQLRWAANRVLHERDVRDPAWTRILETLDRFAAAAVVSADPGGQNAAFRLLIWTVPFEQLVRQQVVRVRGEPPGPRMVALPFVRDRLGQLVWPQLLGRSPEGRGWLARKAWRSARLSRRAIRRRRRRVRDVVLGALGRLARWCHDVALEEGGWHDPNLQSRAMKRDIAFKTLRRLGVLLATPVILIKTPLAQLGGEIIRWVQKIIS
jgi:hypothetical protein